MINEKSGLPRLARKDVPKGPICGVVTECSRGPLDAHAKRNESGEESFIDVAHVSFSSLLRAAGHWRRKRRTGPKGSQSNAKNVGTNFHIHLVC